MLSKHASLLCETDRRLYRKYDKYALCERLGVSFDVNKSFSALFFCNIVNNNAVTSTG